MSDRLKEILQELHLEQKKGIAIHYTFIVVVCLVSLILEFRGDTRLQLPILTSSTILLYKTEQVKKNQSKLKEAGVFEE